MTDLEKLDIEAEIYEIEENDDVYDDDESAEAWAWATDDAADIKIDY